MLKKELQSNLAKDPLAFSDELRPPLQGWRSFHSGKYRVIFKLYSQPKVIVIAGIGEHSRRAERDIYRRLEVRSEEHTSELQSRLHLVCRLLLEKKKTKQKHMK